MSAALPRATCDIVDRMLLGSFALLTPLAAGGMGRVWQAVHEPSGTAVAVKVLLHADDPRHVQAFQEEIRAVARLGHPHVVSLLDQGVVPAGGDLPAGAPWLAMELATGGTLRQRAADLDWQALRTVLDQLLDALGHAHAHGILHRDVKPSNVLFTGEGEALLADFGMGYAFTSGDQTALPEGGTAPYAAPEQMGSDLPMGPWTDLYNLAATTWTLVAGHWPFGRDGRTAVHDLPRLVHRLAVPAGLEGWLHHLLAFDPERRFQCARDARLALADLARSRGGGLVAPPDLETIDTAVTGAADLAVPLPAPWEPPERPGPAPAAQALVEPVGRAVHIAAGASLLTLRRPPLVGREDERRRLWSAVEGLESPRAIAISGPAGVGKSRLADWVAARAHELAGATIVRATHQAERSAADGLLAAIARTLGRTRTLRARWLRLRGWDGSVDDALDVLDGHPPPHLRSEAAQHRVAVGVLARMGRAVVVLDDGQWGPESLVLARRLLQTDLPALVVATLRDDLLARAPGIQALVDALGGEVMPVGPLPEEAREALVRAVLPTTPALTRQLVRRSAGNALFLVTLLDEVRDRLQATAEGYATAGALRLPMTVVELWREQVDRLVGADGERRTALGAAAVLGHEVDLDEWGRVCAELGVAPDEALFGVLGAARLARKVPGGRRWAFAHGMLRESLVTPDLHRAAAAALLAAGDRESAARAGRHLLAAGDAAAALAPLEQGLAYLGVMSRKAERVEVLDLFAAAVEQAGDADRHAVLLRQRADLANQLHRMDELARRLDELESLDRDRFAAHVAWALKMRAVMRSNAGRADEALALVEQATVLARRSGDPDAITLCALELGRQHFLAGTLRPDLFEEAVRAAESMAAWPKVARALTGLFYIAREQGRRDEAEVVLERQGVAAGKSGPGIVATWLENRAVLARDRGELDRAVTLLEEANDLLRRTENAARASLNDITIGIVRAWSGHPEEGEARLAAGLEVVRRHRLIHNELQALVGLLACRAGRPGWEQTRAELDRVLAENQQMKLEFLVGDLRKARELAARAGRRERAASLDALLERHQL